MPGRTTLSLLTGHLHATGRQAFLVDAYLSDSRTVPPYAVFRETLSSGTGGSRRAVRNHDVCRRTRRRDATDLRLGFMVLIETPGFRMELVATGTDGKALIAESPPTLKIATE